MAKNPGNRSGRPRQPSETLNLEGLVSDWDSCECIRERMRNHDLLLDTTGGEDIAACVKCEAVLWPFLTRMSLLQTRPLPQVEPLRCAVQSFFETCKRPSTTEDEANIVSIGWKIRKLLGFIKMKVRRGEVSTVPCLEIRLFLKHSIILKDVQSIVPLQLLQ